MIKVGLTGGMGVGKTTILKEFEKWNIPTYNMDTRLKGLIKEDKELRAKLIEFLGPDVFDENNEYNRKYVSGVIFNDSVKKADLGILFHKYLEKDLHKFYDKYWYARYVVVESAIFYEYDMEYLVDFMVVVDADIETRMARIRARDTDQNENQIQAKLKNQMPQSEKISYCDFVINNNGEVNYGEIERLNRVFEKINELKRNIYKR